MKFLNKKERSVWLKIQKYLRDLGTEKCPDSVVQDLFRIVGESDNLHKSKSHPISWLQILTFRSYAFAVGCAFLIMFCSLVLKENPTRNKTPGIAYSVEDIQQANQELKASLSLIHKISVRSTELISQDILTDRVLKPMKNSMKNIIKPQKGVES